MALRPHHCFLCAKATRETWYSPILRVLNQLWDLIRLVTTCPHGCWKANMGNMEMAILTVCNAVDTVDGWTGPVGRRQPAAGHPPKVQATRRGTKSHKEKNRFLVEMHTLPKFRNMWKHHRPQRHVQKFFVSFVSFFYHRHESSTSVFIAPDPLSPGYTKAAQVPTSTVHNPAVRREGWQELVRH